MRVPDAVLLPELLPNELWLEFSSMIKTMEMSLLLGCLCLTENHASFIDTNTALLTSIRCINITLITRK